MTAQEHRIDDERWRIFCDSLQKVQLQVHPNLQVKFEALQYIEKLIIDLLHSMCSTKPQTTQDVIDQVEKTFPRPIERWAIQDANYALGKKKHKKGEKKVILPVDKVHPLLKELLGYRLDQQVTLCIVAVLEYVAADILKLVGNYVKRIHADEITEEDVRVSMCADKVLNNMFFSNDSDGGSDASGASVGRRDERPVMSAKLAQELTQNYEDLVKDLILSEQQNIRELELIIKVFRPPFIDLFPNSKDIDVIFSNILDVHSFSILFLSMLEDTVEMTEKEQIPLIGGCFEELFEGAEFDVYEKYMSDVMNKRLQDRLYALLKRDDLTVKLNGYDQSFKDVVKYLLPRLLEGPIHHLKFIFNVIEKLSESDQSTTEDQGSFNEALSLLIPLKNNLEKRLAQLTNSSSSGTVIRRHNYGSMHQTDRVTTSALMNDIQRSIENWEEKDINKQCYDFLLEGGIFIYEKAKKDRERYAFLFDNMLIMCKPTGQRRNTPSAHDYRFKEKLLIKHIDVTDIEDTDDLKNGFEIQERNAQTLVLRVRTSNEKEAWMSALLSLLFRSNLDRMLDSKQKEEESAHALILPPVEDYPFSAEDSEENIVLEESHTPGEPPLIQGATLHKLIERLTYHMYADPNFVKRFLTTYRSFSNPSELLDLLIKRFHIPESHECFSENQEAFTRFKKEYVKPVQFRVLNVIRLWTEHHFYDFERENKVLKELEEFLYTIKGKVMRKWVDSILKIIQRKVEFSVHFKGISWESSLSHLRPQSPKFKDESPPVEWFMPVQEELDKFSILFLHPIEIARQETLIEFRMYKAVKPSELVGSVFTKKDKAIQSPNLMKLIRHTNRFTYWLEESIITTNNLEERVAVVSRIIEIMGVFTRLNNLNGVLCVVSALDSAPIHRLQGTLEQLKLSYKKSLDEAKELLSNNYKKYFETLRRINPPCVPFFGVYMTNILKLEEGNPDFLPNTDLINFTKRRKVADITAEIQQYQNQPYNLTPVYSIQDFLENLDPWQGKDDNELIEHLFDLSLQIEPRNVRPPPKFPRKYDPVVLKSPGIKSLNKQTISATIRNHFIGSSESRFPFPNSKDDEDGRSTMSSTPPHTPNTPKTPPPRPLSPPRTPRTPPPNKNTPPRTPPPFASRSFLGDSQISLLSDSSTVRQSQFSLNSQFSAASTATLTDPVFENECDMTTYELKAPPLPPRRVSTAQSVSDLHPSASTLSLNEYRQPVKENTFRHDVCRPICFPISSSLFATPRDSLDHSCRTDSFMSGSREGLRGTPPELPPKLPSRSSVHNIQLPPTATDTELPPRLPPRPPRSRGIERSGSMPGQSDARYSSRRNSGDHVNMNGVTPGTPQLPPKTYRMPNHGRQRSQ